MVLNEVIVQDEDVSSIVESIANQLEKAEIKYGKAFYREISTRNRVPAEWIEAFLFRSNSPKKLAVKISILN